MKPSGRILAFVDVARSSSLTSGEFSAMIVLFGSVSTFPVVVSIPSKRKRTCEIEPSGFWSAPPTEIHFERAFELFPKVGIRT